MNSIMGNHYHTLQSQQIQPLQEQDNILITVMAKISRSVPLQEWQQIHLGMMHASPSTMKIMIDKNLLTDITPSLH